MKTITSLRFILQSIVLFPLQGLGGFLLLWLGMSSGWAQKPELRVQMGHTELIKQIAPLSDGKTFLSASEDGSIIHWDVKSGKIIQKFINCDSIVLLPNSDGFLTKSTNNSIKYYNLNPKKDAYGKEIYIYPDSKSITLLSDGKRFLARGSDDIIRHWDLMTGKEINVYNGCSTEKITLLPNNKGFICANKENTLIEYWDFSTLKVKNKFKRKEVYFFNSVVLLPNNTFLSVEEDSVYHTGKLIKQYNLDNGRLITSFIGHKYDINNILFLPKRNTFLSTDIEGDIIEWDFITGKNIRICREILF